jgi:hypothetical protein
MKLSEDLAVIEWVAQRRRKGATSKEIVADSKAGRHNWPAPGQSLSDGSCAAVYAVLVDRERVGRDPEPRPRKRSGKRMREIQGARRAGLSGLIDVQFRIVQMTSLLESIDVGAEAAMENGNVADIVATVLDDLLELQIWMDHTLSQCSAYLDHAGKLAKIRHMREETAGRTPAEIATARRLADKLERQLDHQLERVAASRPSGGL